jgi:3-oxoacyl-[acyl-carrier protein] reductase
MDGETAVITGASRGIGRAVAELFAEAGAHVVICARSRNKLETVAETIRDDGGTATAVRADVRDEFDVERLMEQAVDGGSIEYVIANAAVYHGNAGETPLHDESYSVFDNTLRTNGRGVFTTLKEALPHLAPDGRILVSSGSVARTAYPGYGAYAVSKATAEAVARGVAADIDHVVGVIDPGRVATELTGADAYDPADVAPQFRWAATEAPADDVDGEIVDRGDWRKATA